MYKEGGGMDIIYRSNIPPSCSLYDSLVILSLIT